MSPALTVAALWALFAATHLTLSSVRVRPRLVARLGERGFLGLYSLVAFATFVPLVWFYATHKHVGPWLWVLPRDTALLAVMWAGNTLAFTLVLASFVTPHPAALGAPAGATARGVLRLVRHPVSLGIALWAATHLLPNASTTDVAFFGGAVVFPVVGAWHQDQRKLALGPPGYREFVASAPFVPLTGETRLGLREIPLWLPIAGLAVTATVRLAHPYLFGP